MRPSGAPTQAKRQASACSIVCIGECMVEMAPLATPNHYVRGFAGDSFNCAWHLKNSMGLRGRVGYFTAVGADQASTDLKTFLAASRLTIDHVLTIPDRSVGLYMIHIDKGERSFSYFRNGSAATQLASDPERLQAVLAAYDWAYFSGITLAILSPEDRALLLSMLKESPARVAFDSNYRPALWSSRAEAQAAMASAASLADIALPSFDDENRLFGDETAEATLERYQRYGTREIIISHGERPVIGWTKTAGLTPCPAPIAAQPIDTTGAGDSFNAGYLATRLSGGTVAEAVHAGHDLAAQVIMVPGALLPA